jgi:hypothetical protein
MILGRGPWAHRAQSLALPLLAALALHGLWLAWDSLRSSRPGGDPRIRRGDDTPELLVFSRQPPEPVPAAPVPPPPPSFSPAPPPLPPRRSAPPPQAGLSPQRARSPAPVRRGTLARPPRPRAKPPLAGRSRAAASGPPAPTQPPSPGPPLPPGEALQRWRDLWRAAAPVDRSSPVPAPLAAAAAAGELRWLPLERLRAQGLDPESGRVLHLDDALLLLWREADFIWLLRTPVASPSDS